MAEAEGKEKRRFLRVDVKLPVTYWSPASPDAKLSVTKDVGGAGICLLTNEALLKGIRVEVELELPEAKQPVRFVGEVVWCGPNPQRPRSFLIGISFLTIKPEDHQAVMRFCVSVLKKQQDAA